jgi:3-oxoacyl-[acyl-carrier protein] reductase
MELGLKDKTVLITGATRGIGKSIAQHFEREGASLILTGTNSEQINKLNKEAADENKRKKYFAVDFSNMMSVKQFIQDIEEYPTIDILINNAGTNIIAEFIETNEEDYDFLLNVNLKAPYFLSKYVVKKMKNNGFGRVVNIASIWSVITKPKRIIYTITKNALHGMTQTMSVELAKYNVLVNTVSPGFTLTELTKSTNSTEELKRLSSVIPIGRIANPDEIAKVVLFLSSEVNTYIVGQNIVVDGGYTNV